ncbi:hypothetical protein [Planctomonas psychrotolerans]|uniref:hypothetical protein n=1 Tax=Planctomonas psychrotolerans TaxID=2528712 RepID=UPI00123C2411|nr:hypothetical protein [Planctomonas psychrotolerans]
MTDNSDSDTVSTGQTPGVQAHMPGEDTAGPSAAGVVPDGTATDTLGDTDIPGESGLSSAGDSASGDDTIPGTDVSVEDGAVDDFDPDEAAQGHS